MKNISIINTTADNASRFGMCGYKDLKNPGFRKKVEWVKERFREGMRYKILHSEEKGAVGAIEYIPGEYAWRPVMARGYMFIHCIFILPKKFKQQGLGKKLLEECIADAREQNMQGVAVISRKGTWMASKDLFVKNGFETVDIAKPDFELLVYKFDKNAENPSFNHEAFNIPERYKSGLHMIAADQCPYIDKARTEITEAARDFGEELQITELKSSNEAQQSPCPFGTFAMIYNGRLVADHPISQTRFRNIMKKLKG